MRTRANKIEQEKFARQPRESLGAVNRERSESLADDMDDRQRGGVQSIERAFVILEEVARNRDGIALSDLSKRVGLHNSTTFHLVKTMVSLGYIRKIKDSKRYRIGRPLFALAASALDEIEMESLATPILENLSRASGESSHFALRMADNVIIIARAGGPGVFQLADRIGLVRPAHCTAIGKIILAAFNPAQLDQYLTHAELRVYSPKTITDIGALRQEIAEVRQSGVAFDDGEFDPEVRCVAVPVRDFTGQTIGAIGISGPIWRMSIATLQNRVRLVKNAAAQLSLEFGTNAGHATKPNMQSAGNTD